MPDKPKRARGKALARPDALIERLAVVSDADRRRAAAAWERAAPAEFRDLLVAEEEERPDPADKAAP